MTGPFRQCHCASACQDSDRTICRSLRLLILCMPVVIAGLAAPLQAQYSPEHPKVQAMVDRAIAFLESEESPGAGGYEYEAGGPILVGYTILKATGNTEHPIVKNAIAMAQNMATNINRRQHPREGKIVYEASIAAVLLATVDPVQYGAELGEVQYFFTQIQKSHGGYGYLGRETGDTSQVQYVMLALWSMREVGLDIDSKSVEATVRYLMSTRDPSGAWGYQGVLSNDGRPTKQDKVSKSLGTAGVGALIIAGDLLDFYGVRKKKQDEEDEVPSAFVRIDLKEKLRQRLQEIEMSRSDTDGAVNAAMRYQNLNPRYGGGYWYYYWRYSQERYESFVEIVNNRQEKSPSWYNDGVDELAGIQDDDGGWGTRKTDVTPRSVSTAFAILFLIRSTQKAIGKLDEGVTFGGYQLPNDVSSVKLMGDRLVSDEETSIENLLTMLEEDEAGGVEVSLLPQSLRLSDEPDQRKEQIARLSRLLVSGDYRARQLAARLLGRTDDLGVVPDLIFAITDPDPLVPMIAEESLRLLSRKLSAGELGRKPTDAERLAAERFWKEWYLGVRPEYIFLNR